jgi:PAS domain S-box-containing protein
MVEDSSLDADLALEELRHGGIHNRTRRVDTRQAFEEALDNCEPDIILSDYSLPGFDGMSALKIAHERCPDIPFIFVSGVIGEEIAIESLKYGAMDYVLKHRIQLLSPAVKRALRTAEERRERRRAQEALGRSEERLRLAVNTARMGTWELDLATGRIEASEICKENFGLPAEADFDLDTMRSLVHPDDRQDIDVQIERALAQDASSQSEFRVIWPDGSVHWIVGHGVGLRDTRGAVTRMVGVTLDITARKQVEENLAKHAQELSLLNTDLRQFAFAASHDLQEPLRMVTVYTQLLAQKFKEGGDEETQMFFSFIETGTSRMGALLRDLQAYLQLQTRERRFARVDMNQVLQRVLQVLDIASRESGASIEAEPLPMVSGDESQLEQVLQNLVSNALKYRDSRRPQIRLSATRDGAFWVFHVRDNGIGFDSHFAEQIFGLFKRLNHHREYPGTGLGLAICRRIVEHHGGQIWACSEPGVGSEFSFSLPVERIGND